MDADITPRNNTTLFGHEAAEAVLRCDLASGRLAHGWIIGGAQGIGKATLAYRFARTLLANEETADVSPDHPVFRRVAVGSHADLLVVEQAYDEKKEEHAREIPVAQAREIGKFLSLTPGEGLWRVVIIDSADALNINAANAILKILEEPPPQAVLMLVSHNPGRLLPTIRSRCRMLRLTPLAREPFEAALRHVAPDIGGEHYAALAKLSGMSPGLAVRLHRQGAIELYAQILELAASLPDPNPAKLHAFAERIGSGQMHSNWQLFTRLMLFLLERMAKGAAGSGCQPLSPNEAPALRKLAALHSPEIWAAKWQQCAEQFSLAERLHLDYRQIVITFFHSLADHSTIYASAL